MEALSTSFRVRHINFCTIEAEDELAGICLIV